MSQRFAADPPREAPLSETALGAWLQPLQQQWHASIHWDTLPWFAEEKARQGAFAALLGLTFESDQPVRRRPFDFARAFLGLRSRRPLRWTGVAVGDCCVFQVRQNALLQAFPVARAADFGSRPHLLSSNRRANAALKQAIRACQGEFQADDLFVLATDALAQWFLARHEAGERPWTALTSLDSSASFASWVAELRRAGLLRNDDTTLILIRWTGKPPRLPASRELVATGLPVSA